MGITKCDKLGIPKKDRKGLSLTKSYQCWRLMIYRCNDPLSAAYKNYGGRGIKVCDRWLEFENFYKDMGEPKKGYAIDRIDNEKGYSKDNCRWVTPGVNSVNKRTTVKILFRGKPMTIAEISKITGISYQNVQSLFQYNEEKTFAVSERLLNAAMSVVDAAEHIMTNIVDADQHDNKHIDQLQDSLEYFRTASDVERAVIEFTEAKKADDNLRLEEIRKGYAFGSVNKRPERKNLKVISFRGERKSITAWAKKLGLRRSALSARLRSGWSIEDALTLGTGEKRRHALSELEPNNAND